MFFQSHGCHAQIISSEVLKQLNVFSVDCIVKFEGQCFSENEFSHRHGARESYRNQFSGIKTADARRKKFY
jgi:hypothetical protein